MTGIVFDIKEMTVHDGDGVRVTVFMKGCPLRCEWCHNPEGLSALPQLLYKRTKCVHCGLCEKPCTHAECQPYKRCLHICPNDCLSVCGETYTPERLAKRLMRYKRLFDACGGGVTFSGGEPLMQSEFLFQTLERMQGIHTAVETCGYVPETVFQKAVRTFDLIIMDIKLYDEALHKKYTGVSNERIKKNFLYLQQSGKPYLVRTPLIKGKTDSEENLAAIQTFIGNSPWEKLAENTLADAKKALLTDI